MITQSLQLQIEKLVLDDYRGMDLETLQQSIMEALEDLIAQGGMPEHLRLSTDIADLAITIEEKAQPAVQGLGKSIAEAIYAGQR